MDTANLISLRMGYLVGIIGLIWKTYIFLIFGITAMLMYPVILPFVRGKNKKSAHALFVFWSRLFRVFTFYFIRTEIRGELPEAPFLILSNHSSYLDIFLMYSVFPRTPFLFLGKSELLKNPLIRPYFRDYNIPVFRGSQIRAAKSLIKTREKVKEGWCIAIFPEGGIPDHEHPKLAPFKAGAFQLAKEMALPIVNITFLNNHLLFSDPTNVLGPARPGISKLIIHPVITTENVAELSAGELMKVCYETINEPILKMKK